METARCRAFVVAADTGSFSKAAEALSYTPSGVNQLVTALEKELGFPLFRRNTKGVSLTENGRLLLPSIRKFLRQEDRIFELSAEMNGLLIGSVNIAAYSSIATHWLPAVIGAFQRDYPQDTCEPAGGHLAGGGPVAGRPHGGYRLPQLSGGHALRLDTPGGRTPCWPCCQRTIRLPAPKPIHWPTAPWTGSSCLPRAASDDLMALFHRTGIVPNVQFTTLESLSAMSMVEQGLGMSVMNKLITERRVCDIVMLPVDPPASITLGIALHSKADLSPAVRMFLKYAVRMLTRQKKRKNTSCRDRRCFLRSAEERCGVDLLIAAEAGGAGEDLLRQLLTQEHPGDLIGLGGHVHIGEQVGIHHLGGVPGVGQRDLVVGVVGVVGHLQIDLPVFPRPCSRQTGRGSS